jgi:hypothetical protein
MKPPDPHFRAGRERLSQDHGAVKFFAVVLEDDHIVARFKNMVSASLARQGRSMKKDGNIAVLFLPLIRILLQRLLQR